MAKYAFDELREDLERRAQKRPFWQSVLTGMSGMFDFVPSVDSAAVKRPVMKPVDEEMREDWDAVMEDLRAVLG